MQLCIDYLNVFSSVTITIQVYLLISLSIHTMDVMADQHKHCIHLHLNFLITQTLLSALFFNKGVTWSVFVSLKTSVIAAFGINCRCLMVFVGRPAKRELLRRDKSLDKILSSMF